MGNKRWKKVVTVIALVAIMLVCGLTCALKWRSIGKSVYHVFRDYDRQKQPCIRAAFFEVCDAGRAAQP